MDRPSHFEREALRQYMAAMEVPTRNLREGIRQSHRVLAKKPLSTSERREILTTLRTRNALPGVLPGEIPNLACESHARWVCWFETAVEAGILLASAIERGDPFQFQNAQLLENQLPTLQDGIITPEMEMWCYPDEVLELPISAAEFEEMLRVRKSNNYPPKPSMEWDRWLTMTCRYLYQHPTSTEKEMWHEAGHIVVGHRLGWSVLRIDRHPDGTPYALIPPPCEPPNLPVLDYSTVAVAGYLTEERAFANAMPSADHVKIATVLRGLEARSGRTLSPDANLAHVLKAEARAQAILEEHWRAVHRIAELALLGLPVEHETLIGELRDVPQEKQVCGPLEQRRAIHRRHALLRTCTSLDRQGPMAAGYRPLRGHMVRPHRLWTSRAS
jgi:hypothetical protein